MAGLNCWEYKKCGREPGGQKEKELGTCPAATQIKANGVHGGKNGGRCCWVVSGTFCGGSVQGTYASKLRNCIECEFYQSVISEVGKARKDSMEILSLLQ